MSIFSEHQWAMELAYEEANRAYTEDEVPVGAVVVSSYGKLLAKTHNLKEKDHNPCGHAEILALQMAAKAESAWRLIDCTVYVTLEPCIMCLAACQQARVGKVIFGAYDKKGGALSLGYAMHQDKRLNHCFSIMGGFEHYKNSRLLSQYFKSKRHLTVKNTN